MQLTNCRCIHQWHHVANVRSQNAIKQAFIAVLQAHQVDVPIQVICAAFKQNFRLLELFIFALHGGRKQAMDAECLTLLDREGKTLEREREK